MKRVAAIFLLLAGLFGVSAGIYYSARGVWPFRGGEPFDLIAFGGGAALFGLIILLRSRRHARGLFISDMPELVHFPSDAKRQEAIDQVIEELRRQRESQPRLTVLIAIASALVTVPVYLFIRRYGSIYLPTTVAKSLGWLVALAILFVPAYLNIRRSAPKLLRGKLLSAGVPVCVECGYILRGCPGPNCPECATPFSNQVQMLIAAEKPDKLEGSTRESNHLF